MSTAKKREANYFIELIRFVFSCIIVYFHVLNQNILSSVKDVELYTRLGEDCKWSSIIVECFLIIGGYFLYHSVRKTMNKSFLELSMNRFFRLWPVMALYTLIMVLFWNLNKQTGLFYITFLHATGISLEETGIIWYIAPYFWSSLLVMAILRKCDRKTSGIILSLIAYFSYAISLNTVGGFSRTVVFDFLSLAVVRCLAGVSVGVLSAMAIEEFRRIYNPENETKLSRGITFSVLSVMETASLAVLLKLFIFGKEPFKNPFVVIIFFLLFFVIAINNAGVLSKVLNRPIFGKLGRYSYSIYVMQQVAFYILRDTLWKNEAFMSKGAFTVCLVSVLFSVLVGVAVYHLFEKPCIKLYQNLKKKYIKA